MLMGMELLFFWGVGNENVLKLDVVMVVLLLNVLKSMELHNLNR